MLGGGNLVCVAPVTAGLHAGADGVNFLASLLLGTLETQERGGTQR
jgi:hypothetical protein